MTGTIAGTITVGGSAAVATAHLEQLAARLDRASVECSEIVARLRPLRTHDSVSRDADLADIDRGLRQVSERLGELSSTLRCAIDLYTTTEMAAARAVETALAGLAASVGFVASRLGVLLLPALVNAALTASAVWAVLPPLVRDAVTRDAATVADRLLPALSDAQLVSTLRVALSLVDDATLGTLGVPPTLVAALGETGLAVSGIDTAAVVVLGLAAVAGSSGVDAVRIHRVGSDLRRGEGTTTSVPPSSLADRVERIPEPGTPIVIERYPQSDGSWHFEVYIAGTDVNAELGGDRPWDMASNVALVGELEASSLQAVQLALRSAGATEASSVVFTGYSQGGAIATALAESGQWNTTGLVTVGAPTGGMPVQGTYPAVVIEHREDLVPVLSGIRRETTAVIVRGEAFSGAVPSDAALPAHEIERYRTTARAADEFDNETLRSTIAALPVMSGNGEHMAFTAVRVARAGG